MKKLLAMFLVLVMALGVTTMAWAEDAKGTAGNPYTLDEFNALAESISGTVYIDLTGKSLQDGLTIGNDTIADHYQYTNWNDNTAPEGYTHNTGRTNTRESDSAVRYLYSTGKPAVNVILTGSVTGAADTGGFNAGTITLKVPDAAKVTFSKVAFGAGQMAMGVWTESFQSTVVNHRVVSITFDGCTFKGNWIQNGRVEADKLTFTGCTFEKYENTKDVNTSSPIWIQGIGNCDVLIEGCTFNAVRPIKLWENDATGATVIKGNTFNMSKATGDSDDTHKNIGIMFCKCNPDSVEVTGNTVTGDASGLMCVYSEDYQPTMKEGETINVSDNTLPSGVNESVMWKSAEKFEPDYIEVTKSEPTPPRYYYNSTTTDTKADGTKGSPKTFDAGMGVYALTAVLSVTGMAYVGKKKF